MSGEWALLPPARSPRFGRRPRGLADQSALLAAEFGGRGLGFGEPIVDNRRCRAGSGSARAAAIWGMRQAFALYATKLLQRQVNKVVKCTTYDC